MNYFKRISSLVLAGIIGLSSTVAVKAESNDEKLNNMQQQLQETMQKCKRKSKRSKLLVKKFKVSKTNYII